MTNLPIASRLFYQANLLRDLPEDVVVVEHRAMYEPLERIANEN